MSHAQTIDRITAADRTPVAGRRPQGELAGLPVLTSLDQVADLMEHTDALFLRISAGPDEDRRSGGWDGESGYLLPGLPAWMLRPEAWWAGGLRLWLARQVVRHGFLLSGGKGNQPWLLTGEVVGRGPDGDPLVARWRPVALLARGVLPEAEAAYAAWRCRDLC
ncbi:DUF6098 family protein [Georgenia sp. SYP-B2076]|uniref:DUF6098 family protein n=1 Tax=Georgenia sp. SYP-B2076 TaxID=2495881 RepID=UPI000F8C3251|nr:DUF6098 family protein [Georgenia sp. SYP-B2076]